MKKLINKILEKLDSPYYIIKIHYIKKFIEYNERNNNTNSHYFVLLKDYKK